MALFDGILTRRKRSGQPRPTLPRTAPRRLGIMALEPRMMYDAAAAATVAATQTHSDGAADVAASVAAAEKQPAPAVSNTGVPADSGATKSLAQAPNVQTPDTPAPGTDRTRANTPLDAIRTDAPADNGTRRDVVFIDPQSGDLMGLYGGAKPGDLVFVLDPNKDGVQQIADILAAQDLHDLDAIHIVSHGMEAEVKLGTTVLTDGNLADHADALAAIGKALKPGGDLMLYGCDVAAGSDGQQFIHDLARLTGADVAASTDETGSAALGGDWTLEAATGAITATNPFTDAALANYEGLLSIAWTVKGTATGTTNADQSITTVATGTDPFPTIQFGGRMITADFNNDGNLDVLYQDHASGSVVHLALGNGNGTFQAPINTVSGTFTSGPLNGVHISDVIDTNVYTVDLNGDGKVDLVLNQGGNTAPVVYQNTGSGFTLATNPFPTQQFAGRFVFGDFNNDGYTDVLNQTGNVSGTGITLYVNKADGTIGFNAIAKPAGTAAFSSGPLAGLAFTQVTTLSVFAVDLNGDGKTDIIDNQLASVPIVYQNNGASFSQVTSPFASNQFSGRFVFADFNSDGYLDVLNQVSNVSGSGITLYLNSGNGNISFSAIAKPAGSAFSSGPLNGVDFTNISFQSMLVGDWDRDGDADILESSALSNRYLTQGATGDVNGHPPHLASSSPADNSIGVAQNANITLTFDQSVSKGSGNISIVRTSDNVVVETIAVTSGQVTGSGTSWTIDPSITLAAGVSYAVRIDARTSTTATARCFSGSTTTPR
jgi:hypothetical protein